MSSLTKLLQDRRKNEIPTSNLTSSLQAAVVTQQGLLREQMHGGIPPIAEHEPFTERGVRTRKVGRSDSDSDNEDFVRGSPEVKAYGLQSILESNSSSTAAMHNSGTFTREHAGSLLLTEDGRSGRNGRSFPSLSSGIPYSVPNSNSGPSQSSAGGTGNESTSVGSANASQWMDKYGNSLPKNISAIDSNVILSPKVDSVEPRFVISRQKLQKSCAEGSHHSLSRSNSLTSQLGTFFFNRNAKDPPSSIGHHNSTSANSGPNKENVPHDKSIPRPIRGRKSSLQSAYRQPTGSFNDSFTESPPFNEHYMNQPIPKSRHTSFADLKRFFRKNSSGSQSSVSPGTPPISTGSFSSHSSNHSSLISTSYANQLVDNLYNHATSGLCQGIPFSKRYSKMGEKLGAGAGGSVKLVKRLRDNAVFAVKEFRAKYDTESKRDYVKKIISEYCIGITLRNPNIISTVEITYDNNRILQVMEYCDYDLFAIVMSNKMSYEEICCCFRQILQAVEYLHSLGLAHRDLKLDNCVINSQGIVKLIDFGAAVVFTYPHSGTLVEASGIVGSDPYLAPEVCIFTKYDPRPVDIWSVAIIFSCMILKKFPWKVPKLRDNSFKLFCSGRDCDSLGALVSLTPNPPSYETAVEDKETNPPKSNNASDPNNPNIGPQRLLHSLPEESQHIIGRMIALAPACRASIEEIMEDDWIQSIEMCYVLEATGRTVRSESHAHTEVDQSEAHIAGLEKKNKKTSK
ncbi:HBR517Wp [Eremothecium sinecaudum]|uniref:non-specific serine/threonine protein kinase n=1 Tax=Eremothecium sinecaudum TaxID=45286 RepID=A0A109UXS3_9SACH|nr:HBR517Wp [Eremothecium sinecaudum]AMD19418.1 HBR517Wp [Eremothecium sinecaudum]